MTIVGVTPRGFEGTSLGSRPHVYVPLTMRGLMEPGFVRPTPNGDGFANEKWQCGCPSAPAGDNW